MISGLGDVAVAPIQGVRQPKRMLPAILEEIEYERWNLVASLALIARAQRLRSMGPIGSMP